MNDLRYVLRGMVRRPAIAIVVVATLAIGIGANTAIFSAIDAAVLRPPPFPAPDELRLIRPTLAADDGRADTLRFWSYPMYEAFRDAEPSLDGSIAAYTPRAGAYNLETAGAPERARVEFVSASYFPVLGIGAALGRTFVPDEDRVPGQAPVAILSHGAWSALYGGDSTIVGRTIRLNTIAFTVVGVAEAGFRGLSEQADVWVPMMMAPALTFPFRLRGSVSFWHAVVARTPNATDGALAPRLALKARAVEPAIPLADVFGPVELGFTSLPLASARVHPTVRATLTVLMGAVAFVLLIVCVNVANLLLTQAARRRREVSVRVALGAGPRAIARVQITESVVLATLGGVAGLLVGTWVLDLIRVIAPALPAGVADPAAASLGARVVVFNFAVAAVAGALVGLLPALKASRTGPLAAIKEDDGRGTGRSRLRGALIAGEVALALVLLTGAGLMLRSLEHLRDIDPGFRADGLLSANVSLPSQAYSSEETVTFLDAARRRLAAEPGVNAATVAYCLPVAGGCDNVGMTIRGRADGDAPPPPVAMNMVEGTYFRTMGIPLLRGRSFDTGDRVDAPRVAVLSRAAAEQHWPDGDALGARIQLTVGWEDDAEVIGIVDDVRIDAIDAPPPPLVYLPYTQQIYNANYLIVRTAGAPLDMTEALRAVVGGLDAGLPLWDIQTMDERVGASFADTRFTTVLLTVAAALATFLAALGVFGVMAFTVAGRTRELGVRMALGARQGDVMRLVLRQGMQATIIGLSVGILGAGLLTRVLAGQLRGIGPLDPVAFAGGAVVMALAALAAAWLPARRATRIDPMEALRHE